MSLQQPYEHTQVGWVTLASLLLPIGVLAWLMRLAGPGIAFSVPVAALVVLALLFGWLTVRVDGEAISWRFGIGLGRRRIDLAEIRAFAQVLNPWYWGWGIRWYREGTLYNVSGLAAVEFALRNGGRVRVGTDEPEALAAALEAELGPSMPLSEVAATASAGRRHAAWLLVAVIALLLAGLAVLLALQARPPVVTVSSDSVTVQSLFYGQTYSAAEIRQIRLVPRLPRIRARTNGYAAGGTLRGWFDLDELGRGKLFVEIRHSPFILIRLRDGFVAVNFADPTQTERLFAELRRTLPSLAE